MPVPLRSKAVVLSVMDLSLLIEAAQEVAVACPWVSATGTKREIRSMMRRGLLAFTGDLFAISLKGIVVLSRHDRDLARKALAGLRRERAAGDTPMPWEVVCRETPRPRLSWDSLL